MPGQFYVDYVAVMTYNSPDNAARQRWLAISTGCCPPRAHSMTDKLTLSLFANFSPSKPASTSLARAGYYHIGTLASQTSVRSDPMSIRERKICDDFLQGILSHKVLAHFSSYHVFISHPLIKKHMASQHRAHPLYCFSSNIVLKTNRKRSLSPKWPILRMFLRVEIAC